MIIGFSPAILMPCWAMGSGTLSPDLLSLHPASGQAVPVASKLVYIRSRKAVKPRPDRPGPPQRRSPTSGYYAPHTGAGTQEGLGHRGAAMHDLAYELRRITIPRTPVNSEEGMGCNSHALAAVATECSARSSSRSRWCVPPRYRRPGWA